MSGEGPTPPPSGAPTTPNPVVRLAARMAAVIAGFLLLVLVVGVFLPGEWRVERSVVVEAAPDRVFPLLDELRRWEEWTPWPGVEMSYEGPAAGAGAARRWDDRTMGDGVFRVVASEASDFLAYEVAVQDSTILTEGRLTLDEVGGATRITWTESGDFGWNPLMGYVALGMDRLQGRELAKALERLAAVVEGRPLPSDSVDGPSAATDARSSSS